MKQTSQRSLPVVGAGSLLAAFAVLCLTVFAMLSISTVQAEQRRADAAVQMVEKYYAADMKAEALFAGLRNGETADSISCSDGLYTYECAITENQSLHVELTNTSEGWQVLCWQTISREPEENTENLPVWRGE
jgi:hypothetical protein